MRTCRTALAAFLFFVLSVPLAFAQPEAPNHVRMQLEAFRLELGQIEAGVENRNVPDAHLAEMRRRVSAIVIDLRGIADEAAPRAEALRARLRELGPKPDDKPAAESPDLAPEREERDKALKEADETLRLARRLIVQADQVIASIGDKRRSIFTENLFRRSTGLVSPGLWIDVLRNLPTDVAATATIFRDAGLRAIDRVGVAGGAATAAVVVLVLLAAAFARRTVDGLVKNRLRRPDPLTMPAAALAFAVVGFGIPAAAAFLLHQIVTGGGILPPRLEPMLVVLLGGFAFLGLIRGLAEGVLAPGRPAWRLAPIDDERAEHLASFLTATALLLVLGRLFETLFQAIAAGLPLTLATRGSFVVLIALAVLREVRRFGDHAGRDDAAAGGGTGASFGLVRAALWLVLPAAIGAALIGFVGFASFLIDQLVWTGLVVAFVVLLLRLADAAIGAAVEPDGRALPALGNSLGVTRRALQQIAVLIAGFARLFLGGLAVLLVLAPWGIESGDLLFSLRSALFGFRIGDVTISFATVFAAAVILAGGIVLTRAVQKWLKTRFLPQTEMDAGLKNSITTGIGYIGVIAATATALSSLGLSLDKLAIVAGALSVGIGFGLQSIVNNFVSGLILLWERTIRVGDLVVVGQDQGYVRRINVRSTEIDTFDRATVIVPNSNLVSGVVKNRVYTDRTSRVQVAVPLPRDVDPDRIVQVLRDAAEAHADVLEDPPPRVFLKAIGASSLDFELVCFVAEVDVSARVTSDLNFAIWRKIREEGLLPPSSSKPEAETETTKDVEVRVIARNDDEETTR